MMKYKLTGKLRLEEYGQCGTDEYQIASPIVVDVSHVYREGAINDDGGRTLHDDRWTMGVKNLGCAVSGNDFDRTLGEILHYIDNAIGDSDIPYKDGE